MGEYVVHLREQKNVGTSQGVEYFSKEYTKAP
jgi:hypothetical protein